MKKEFLRFAAAAVSTCFVASAAQAYVDITVGKITHIYTYADYGDGDIAVRTENTHAQCAAWWFRLSDPGGRAIYAQLLAAQATDRPLRFGAREEQRWAGSTGQYCRIDFVSNP